MAYRIYENIEKIVMEITDYNGIYQQPNKLLLNEHIDGTCSICNNYNRVYANYYRQGGGKGDKDINNDLQIKDKSGKVIKWYVTRFYLEYLLYNRYSNSDIFYMHVINNKAAIKYFNLGRSLKFDMFYIYGEILQKIFYKILFYIKVDRNSSYEYESQFENLLLKSKDIIKSIKIFFDIYMDHQSPDTYGELLNAREKVIKYAEALLKND